MCRNEHKCVEITKYFCRNEYKYVEIEARIRLTPHAHVVFSHICATDPVVGYQFFCTPMTMIDTSVYPVGLVLKYVDNYDQTGLRVFCNLVHLCWSLAQCMYFHLNCMACNA